MQVGRHCLMSPAPAAPVCKRRVSPLVRSATLMAAALVAVGCRAAVTTGFDVAAAPDPTVRIVAALELDPVAAAALDPGLQARLEQTFAQRTGQRPRIERAGGALRIEAPVAYSQLQDLAPLTGVADVRLELLGDDLAVLHADLVFPQELVDAIVASGAEQPDGAALVPTMLRFTQVGVTVRFAGGIVQVRTPEAGVAPTLDGDTVQVVQPLDRFIAGPVIVAGALTAPSSANWWPKMAAGLSVLLLSGAVWWVRRRP